MAKIHPVLITAFAPLMLGAALLPQLSHADEAERQIAVTGKAERRVAPDMAVLQLGVMSENADAAVARREADDIINRALSVLRDAKLADADIDTTGLTISPQYRWLPDVRKQELTGYRATRNIEVRLLDLDALGVLVTELTDAGINRMQSPRLGLQDEEQVYQEVLAAAAQNARARAEVLANALGEDLGSVVSLSTERAPAPQPMRAERMMMAADVSPAPPEESYSPGYLQYSVTLNATFELD
ncbi:SIMPL domain-containing protein [Congregibacter sp.]|uniref:SIMPL domain-containing protein n=1 Tax=Congregibacter sp. TaxID=2744308 RepID=UPI003F6CBF0C